MNLENKKQIAYFVEILCCFLYIILLFVAMIFYPGGNPVDRNSQGYSFWQTSLSALGASVSYSGADNTVSMVIFTTATSIFGFSFILLFASLPSFFTETSIQRKLSLIGSIFGIIAGICMIGIAFTPANLYGGAHILFVYIGYTSITAMGIIYSIALYLNKKFSSTYTISHVIFTVVWYICVTVMFFGLYLGSAQKIGRFTTVAALIILGYGALKLERI